MKPSVNQPPSNNSPSPDIKNREIAKTDAELDAIRDEEALHLVSDNLYWINFRQRFLEI
jgi:hypothetical protein